MANVSDRIESTKQTVTEPLPTSTPSSTTQKRVAPKELLERLRWGEPALTIVDIRDREEYNGERITGAVPMPISQLPDAAEPQLEYQRDIYIYGDSDETVADAANQLRQAGYQNVAEVQGGLPAWKEIDGPTEGVYAFPSPVERPQPSPEPEPASESNSGAESSSSESNEEPKAAASSDESSESSEEQPQS